MGAFLVDESCPRAVAEALGVAGHDVLYAADTNRRAADAELVALAHAEGRIIVSEDFDFGELLVRHQLPALGAIVLHLPRSTPEQRAQRLTEALAAAGAVFEGRLTIITARQIRQRALTT